jgi:hypothetical protein
VNRGDIRTFEGTAAALATCLLYGDADGFEAAAVTMPPLPYVLEDAAALFHDAAIWSLSVWLGRNATEDEAALIWATERQRIVEELVYRHDLTMDGVDDVTVWLAVILAARQQAWLPASMPVLHLTLAVGCTAEFFRSCPEQWSRFLLSREAHRG